MNPPSEENKQKTTAGSGANQKKWKCELALYIALFISLLGDWYGKITKMRARALGNMVYVIVHH